MIRHASAAPTSAIAAATDAAGRRGGDRGLRIRIARPDGVDEIGIEQQRRMLQHQRGDVGLIGDQRVDHGMRRFRLAHSASASARRTSGERIVEQHDHRAFGGDAVVVRRSEIE